MEIRSGPRNTEAPLRETSKSSRGNKSPRNVRLLLVEENYSNRSRYSHATVTTSQLSLAPERGGLARCPSRFAVLLASTHCPLWLGCVNACRSIRPTKPTGLLFDVNNKACKIQPWLRTDLKSSPPTIVILNCSNFRNELRIVQNHRFRPHLSLIHI